MNELAKFNQVLKKNLNDAKVLEQTHPKKSIPLWINIVQYIVSFAKSKHCPVHLKRKLVEQADQILARVKNLQAQFEPINTADSSKIISTTESGSASPDILPSGNEITEADILSLPDVPQDVSIDDDISAPTSKNIPLSPNSEANKNDSMEQDKFNANLKRLEEELKKMPTSFKEITTAPTFSKPTEASTPITLDITTSEVGSNVNEDPHLHTPSPKNETEPTFQVAGFRTFNLNSDQDVSKSKNNNIVNKTSIDTDAPKRVCFACGSAVGLKDIKCSNCGTPLT